MTTGQTLEQRRAAHAWKAVQNVCRSSAQDYRHEAKRLPVRILSAGLGHAVAFANAKGGAKQKVAKDVADWVLERLNSGPEAAPQCENGDQAQALMCRIVENDADWLRRATEESLAYLQWLSRFAEAEIRDEGTGP